VTEGCTEFDVKYWYLRNEEPLQDWREDVWDPGIPTFANPFRDGNPDGSEDPFVLLGHFYNGCPPNAACMRTMGNSTDEEDEFQFNGEYAADHPNWWYLPRMMQIRIKLTDPHNLIEQAFTTRVFIPSANPYPKVIPY
jgi:hypothetical protein